MVKATTKIGCFREEHAFLSNFAPAPVVLNNQRFPTVEHAFQAAKTLSAEERLRIYRAPTPGMAKKLGRSVTLRPHWEKMRIGVMRALLVQKFAHAPLSDQLLETYPYELEEGNTWSDCFWGVDTRTGKGSNHLGKLLMEIRYNLYIQHAPLESAEGDEEDERSA